MKICPSPHLVYAYLFSKYSLLDILTNMVFTARIKISSSRDICPGKKVYLYLTKNRDTVWYKTNKLDDRW